MPRNASSFQGDRLARLLQSVWVIHSGGKDMRAPLLITCAIVAVAFASLAQATPTPAAVKATNAQMNKLIRSVCSIELGNGAYAFRSYDPKTFTRRDAVKLIVTDMKNFESKGVRFKTCTGATQVKRQLATALEGDTSGSLTRLTKAIDGFKKLGVLQDVVYRGLSGGKAVGDTYFSIPHQVFFCLKTPSQKGKRLEVFMEWGD
jgi:hypothetical protein